MQAPGSSLMEVTLQGTSAPHARGVPAVLGVTLPPLGSVGLRGGEALRPGLLLWPCGGVDLPAQGGSHGLGSVGRETFIFRLRSRTRALSASKPDMFGLFTFRTSPYPRPQCT